MENINDNYSDIILEFYKIMIASNEIADLRIAKDKWTLKEMVGHLIDSASNNHQRFIRLQIDKRVELPGYEAEEWNSKTKVTIFEYINLVNLWKLYNDYLIHIIEVMDPMSLKNVWVSTNGEKELQYIVKDYFSHIMWHIDLFKERIEEIKRRNITPASTL